MVNASPVVFAVTLWMAAAALSAEDAARAAYHSPYSVKFSFKEDDLIGDLLKGPRGDLKHESSVPFRDWYNTINEKRWGYWGPPAQHFDLPGGLASKSREWSRERIIATGLRLVGYSYQHHHVPDWDPPSGWTQDAEQKSAPGKGLDCSNFTAFVYNLALGIKPTGSVADQAEMTEAAGPGAGRRTPVKRIELPKTYADYEKELLTGDLLYINNSSGRLSHVVLWVGKIGQSPDNTPLILDSTGTGGRDAKGNEIPNGIYLRPFKSTGWYFRQASHVLRIIPEGN